MDPQSLAQITQSAESASHQLVVMYVIMTFVIAMGCLVVCGDIWVFVSSWRREQRDRAAHRVRDRLEREEDPEGWARRQAHQALEAALIDEELAAMRRARWHRRLLARARR